MWYVCVTHRKTLNGKTFPKSMIVMAFEKGGRRKNTGIGNREDWTLSVMSYFYYFREFWWELHRIVVLSFSCWDHSLLPFFHNLSYFELLNITTILKKIIIFLFLCIYPSQENRQLLFFDPINPNASYSSPSVSLAVIWFFSLPSVLLLFLPASYFPNCSRNDLLNGKISGMELPYLNFFNMLQTP